MEIKFTIVIGLLDQTLPPVDIVKQEYTEWMQCSPFLCEYMSLLHS